MLDLRRSEPEMNEEQPILLNRLASLARWRRLIILNTAVVAIAAVIVSLLLPKWYRSTASVFPPQEETFSLGTLSSIVAATALGPGRSNLPIWATPSDVYAAILKSRSVREEIIRRYGLMELYEVDTVDEALLTLRSRAKVRVGGEGIVSITVVDKSADRAAAMANDFVALLDAKSKERRRTSAGAVREFLERRVADCRDSLEMAESQLQSIQEETGILVPEDQARALIESAVQIDLGRKMREVQLGMLRAQVGPDDPDRAKLSREIDLMESKLRDMDRGARSDTASFRVPLSKLPERTVAYTRALREVKIQEAIYEFLTQQLEQYRVNELRDTPTLQVLDAAVPAEKRWRPIRWLICTIATLLAFGASCLLAWSLDGLERMRRDRPAEWASLAASARSLHPKRWFSPADDPPGL